MAQHTAMAASELAEGEGRAVDVAGKALAIFHVEGEFYAIDNACPHRGGSLGEGALTGTKVMCPLHAWSFDVRNGEFAMNPAVKVGCYATSVVDGQVMVEVGS